MHRTDEVAGDTRKQHELEAEIRRLRADMSNGA